MQRNCLSSPNSYERNKTVQTFAQDGVDIIINYQLHQHCNVNTYKLNMFLYHY